jgi:hypothetical protein
LRIEQLRGSPQSTIIAGLLAPPPSPASEIAIAAVNDGLGAGNDLSQPQEQISIHSPQERYYVRELFCPSAQSLANTSNLYLTGVSFDPT